MKSLRELQETFQRGILAGDDSILAEVNDSAKEQRKVLFGVYRNAYVARLAEILADDYAQLHAYLGDQAFAKLVKAYIDANPSDQRSARWFGRHLPDFVRESATYAKHPELAEIADLEKALADAFDGPDAAPLTIEALAALPPEAWPHLTLEPHPTAIRLTLQDQCRRDLVGAEGGNRAAQANAVARAASHRGVAAGVHGPLQAADRRGSHDVERGGKGVEFGVLCEMVATFAGEDEAELRAATYLKGWVDMGMLAGFPTQ